MNTGALPHESPRLDRWNLTQRSIAVKVVNATNGNQHLTVREARVNVWYVLGCKSSDMSVSQKSGLVMGCC